MSTITLPTCGCGGTLGFPTGLPVFVGFEDGHFVVEVDMNEVDDIDQEFVCDECDEPEVSDDAYNVMQTLLTYLSVKLRVDGRLPIPDDETLAQWEEGR